MKRTPLALRALPNYTPGEELANMLTHLAGSILGIAVLVLCVLNAAGQRNGFGIIASAVYGFTMIAMFCVSSIYHGLKPSLGKKVMQVIDHCTIYFLIAGTYTAVVLSGLRRSFPALAWGLFGFEWGLAVLAAVFTAIDLHQYSVFSMICYIGMGWAILPFWQQVVYAMTVPGFALLLAGGIAYTIGSVLYGLGKRKKWMHSIFHVFVLLGAGLQFLVILFYAL